MTEAEHLENMEFIRQASENAKVALVLEEIKKEIAEVLDYRNDLFNEIMQIIDKHMM